MYDDFGFTDALCAQFSKALLIPAPAPEQRLHRFVSLPLQGVLRDDSLPISSSEVQRKTICFRKSRAAPLNRIQSKKCLDDASFHVENAGAVYAAGGDSKRHFRQCATGIDGVIVPEHQKLRARFCLTLRVGDAQMRAAFFLLQQFNSNAAFIPFRGDYLGADVSGSFFRAWRFGCRQMFSKFEACLAIAE